MPRRPRPQSASERPLGQLLAGHRPQTTDIDADEPGRERGDWLLSFTDITLLLMVFFVILVLTADQGEAPESQAGHDLLPGFSGLIPPEGPSPAEAAAAAWARQLDALAAQAGRFLDTRDLRGAVALTRTATGVRLRLADNLLFASGRAEIRPAGAELLRRLQPLLADVPGTIRIEGHTDNVPIATARYPSNWELSAARAIAVVRRLIGLGLAERRLEAIGYGANRPIASNATAEGRARNRRVAVVLVPQPPTLEAPRSHGPSILGRD